VIGYVGGVLISLGTAAILVRHLGIRGFGRYVTVTSLIALVGGVTEAGAAVYGIREYVVRDRPERRHLLQSLLTMRLALASGGVAVAACFALATGYAQALVLGTLICGAGLLVQIVTDILSVPLQAQLILGRLAVVEFARRVMTLLAIAALAALGASLLPFFAVTVLVGAAAMAAMAWLVRGDLSIRLRFDRDTWRALFAETLPYAIALSIAAVYFYVTVVVMSLVSTPTQTGLFATSFRVTQAALTIPSLLLTAIFPLLSQRGRSHADVAASVGKVFRLAVICGAWMSLAIVLGASLIIRLIAGHGAPGAVSVLQIQGVVLIFSFISTSSALSLVALRRYRPLIVASSVALALNIVLDLLLIPATGAEGGALADVLTEAIMASVITFSLVKALSGRGLDLSFLPALVAASAVAGATALLPVGAVVRVAGATVLYVGVLLLTHTLPRELGEATRRLGKAGSRP
jgi:O-antigen/teichoic acid export membrane protein